MRWIELDTTRRRPGLDAYILLQLPGNMWHRCQLQSVKHTEARLIMRTDRRERITPVLREMYFLPVRCRVDFSLARFVFETLHGLALPDLSVIQQLTALLHLETF